MNKITLTEVTEEKLTLSDGSTISYYHEQDCCENVYADFLSLKDQIGFIFNDDLKIRNVPNSGFNIGGLFVPCYDYQNGYYSNNLTIILSRPNLPDISESVDSLSDYYG